MDAGPDWTSLSSIKDATWLSPPITAKYSEKWSTATWVIATWQRCFRDSRIARTDSSEFWVNRNRFARESFSGHVLVSYRTGVKLEKQFLPGGVRGPSI